ncbi:hypothetical protein K1719_046164 [Acacia pycnantha]|nr:hypothetical protein K1719_046164 [Acacia pycnantha]
MRGITDRNLLQFDPEIEKTTRRNRKLANQRKGKASSSTTETEPVIMAENVIDPPPPPKRTMGDYMMLNPARAATSIVNPAVNANNFEIKPSLISLVQQRSFSGSDLEDPNQHIETFLQICDTIKMNGVSEAAIRVRLFPFSLTGKQELGFVLVLMEVSPLGTLLPPNSLRNFSLLLSIQSGIGHPLLYSRQWGIIL